MITKTRQHEDELCNQNWQALLSEFKSINSESKDAKEKYSALKEKIKGTNPLGIRQTELLIYRCNNYVEYWKNQNKTTKQL